MRENEIIETLKKRFENIPDNFLDQLVKRGELKRINYRGINFYLVPEIKRGVK